MEVLQQICLMTTVLSGQPTNNSATHTHSTDPTQTKANHANTYLRQGASNILTYSLLVAIFVGVIPVDASESSMLPPYGERSNLYALVFKPQGFGKTMSLQDLPFSFLFQVRARSSCDSRFMSDTVFVRGIT